jgi:hypothetical protein
MSESKLLASLSGVDRNREELWVDGHAKDLSALNEFPDLRVLSFYRLSKRNIPLIESLKIPTLEVLSLRIASIPDLHCLSRFHTIKELGIWQSHTFNSLDGLAQFRNLTKLFLMQNGGLKSLEPIASLMNLEELYINGGVFIKQKVSSFEPIARLQKKFKVLDLSGTKCENSDLSPLTRLPEPDEFGISARFYPIEQIAILAAAFPRWKERLVKLQTNNYSICKKCGEPKKMTFKYRMRDLCPACDSLKIEQFLSDFEQLVSEKKEELRAQA